MDITYGGGVDLNSCLGLLITLLFWNLLLVLSEDFFFNFVPLGFMLAVLWVTFEIVAPFIEV